MIGETQVVWTEDWFIQHCNDFIWWWPSIKTSQWSVTKSMYLLCRYCTQFWETWWPLVPIIWENDYKYINTYCRERYITWVNDNIKPELKLQELNKLC